MTQTVVLLHGWPGATSDYRRVVPLLPAGLTVVVPELANFGAPAGDASAGAHAARILDQFEGSAIVVGYDIGSRIAQTMARTAPDRVAGLVIAPAYPGVGTRPFELGMHEHTWYQHFHRNGVAADLIDGSARAVRTYLTHLWSTWSRDPSLATGESFDALVAAYARPGAFRASVEWYSANKGYAGTEAIAAPTVFLWPTDDPLFPIEWADNLDDWFTDVRLRVVDGSGHFVPLEAPEAVVDAVGSLLAP